MKFQRIAARSEKGSVGHADRSAGCLPRSGPTKRYGIGAVIVFRATVRNGVVNRASAERFADDAGFRSRRLGTDRSEVGRIGPKFALPGITRLNCEVLNPSALGSIGYLPTPQEMPRRHGRACVSRLPRCYETDRRTGGSGRDDDSQACRGDMHRQTPGGVVSQGDARAGLQARDTRGARTSRSHPIRSSGAVCPCCAARARIATWPTDTDRDRCDRTIPLRVPTTTVGQQVRPPSGAACPFTAAPADNTPRAGSGSQSNRRVGVLRSRTPIAPATGTTDRRDRTAEPICKRALPHETAEPQE